MMFVMQHQVTQHNEMLDILRQMQQGQARQEQRMIDMTEEMAGLNVRVNNLHQFIHHTVVPDLLHNPEHGRGRGRGRGRGPP